MRIFTWVQLLWEQKGPAGAGSDTNSRIHRTPAHTSFNFMRHYCRDTTLGRLPLGFSWLQREPWTRFRARTFPAGKVTLCPLSPALSPDQPPPPTAASRCLPALPMGTQPRDVLLDVGPPLRGTDLGPGTPGRLLGEQTGEAAPVWGLLGKGGGFGPVDLPARWRLERNCAGVSAA